MLIAMLDIIIICPNPKCSKQTQQRIPASISNHTFCCPACQEKFESYIVKIRAKNGRGNKRQGMRHFSVRVIEFDGKENLLEFDNNSYDNFDLRSKDLVVFSQFKGKLRIVQNLTIGQYMRVEETNLLMVLIVAIMVLIVLIIIFYWAAGGVVIRHSG